MKYLVNIAWELDGHAGSEIFLVTSERAVKERIDRLFTIVDPNTGQEYTDGAIRHTVLETPSVTTLYGDCSTGSFSIRITKFKNYCELLTMQPFTRTG